VLSTAVYAVDWVRHMSGADGTVAPADGKSP